MVEAEEDDAFRVLANIERLSLEANAKIDLLPRKPGPGLEAITHGIEQASQRAVSEITVHLSSLRSDFKAHREATERKRGKWRGMVLLAATGVILGAVGAIGAITVHTPAFLMSDLTSAKCVDLTGRLGVSGQQDVCFFDVTE